MTALGLLAALLLMAPPASNFFWGVNGFRSLPTAGQAGLLLVAAVSWIPAARRMQSAGAWAALSVGLGAILAFGLPERIHLLGDTQMRIRAMLAFSNRIVLESLGSWSSRLHASPLDVLVNFFGPIALNRAGLGVGRAVGWVDFALGLLALVGMWRVSARLGPAPGTRVGLALALALNGMLQAFAGYAESGALLLAATWWWWAEILAPLDGARQALRLAAAWVALTLCHRIGIVLALPMLWRALGPAFERDQPAARRLLLIAIGAIAVMGSLVLAVTGVAARLAIDVRELVKTASATGWQAAPTDLLNAILVVAPLAAIAPWLAGAGVAREAARRPDLRLGLLAAFPLLAALVWLFPVGDSGLGAHRDWDANLLLGTVLTVCGGILLARLPAKRLRGALIGALPALALAAGGWVAANAYEAAAVLRAQALLDGPPSLPPPQRSHLELWFGQRAMDRREFAAGGEHFDRAFEASPNPRRALLAAEAWVRAGDPDAARRSLAGARARGPLGPELELSAQRIERMVAAIEPDSSRLPAPPGAR